MSNSIKISLAVNPNSTDAERREQRRLYNAAYRKKNFERDKDKINASQRAHRAKNIERIRKRDQQYWANNSASKSKKNRRTYVKHSESRKASARRYKICKIYGSTEAAIDELFKQQKNKCGICKLVFGSPKATKGTKPHIDHCHTTGRVRGILCGRCNVLIGMALENPKILAAAAKYVGKHK